MHAMYSMAKGVLSNSFESLRAPVLRGAKRMAAHISLDLWSSRASKSYGAVLIHGLTDSFEMVQRCLMCREFTSIHHTGEEIKNMIDVALQEANLTVNDIGRAVHDKGANVVKGAREATLKSHLCTAHGLQRSVAVALKKVPLMRTSLQLASRAVQFFNKSNVASGKLRVKQQTLGLFPHKLIQSNATRWSSQHAKADRVCEQRPAFESLWQEDDHRPVKDRIFAPEVRLIASDFDHLIDFCAIMDPIRQVTIMNTDMGCYGVGALMPGGAWLPSNRKRVCTPSSMTRQGHCGAAGRGGHQLPRGAFYLQAEARPPPYSHRHPCHPR